MDPAALSCSVNHGILFCNDGSRWHQEQDQATGEMYWFYVAMTALCVTVAAFAAGLTMGLVSLEEFDMELLLHTQVDDLGDAEEKEALKREQKCAARILPIISDHHRVLVTLLLLNAAANEALPVFLERLVPPWAAILCSVTIVLFFGEIIPSAIFTGPNQLDMASRFAPLVSGVEFVLYPCVKPISMVLDACLGHEDKGRYNKAELKALVGLHKEHPNSDMNRSGGKLPYLSDHEALLLHGALELNQKNVQCAMLSMEKVHMLEMNTVLDLEAMANLVGCGHSRIPVYEGTPHNIRGILIIKSLVVVDPNDSRRLDSLGLRIPLTIPLDYLLMDLLKDFQTGKSHMAIVCSDPQALRKAWRDGSPIPANVHMAGVITLEDVVEELIQSEIYDESDFSVKDTLAGVAFKTKRLKRLREVVRVWQEKNVRRKSQSLIGRVRQRIFIDGNRRNSVCTNGESPSISEPLLLESIQNQLSITTPRNAKNQHGIP